MLAATGRPRSLRTIEYISNVDFDLLRQIFGQRALLEEVVVFLHALLPSKLYSAMLKYSMRSLFDWKFKSLSTSHLVYSHLYCSTSVCLILHWFYIIRNRGFFQNGTRTKYPLDCIPKDKIFLFFGQQDTLEDKEYLLKQINLDNCHFVVPNYEHLDFLWSPNNPALLYPRVLNVLRCECK